LFDWRNVLALRPESQTTGFQIGANRRGHTLGVHQSDGYVAYLYPSSYGNVLTTWDENGMRLSMPRYFRCAVDVNQDGRLIDKPRTKSWDHHLRARRLNPWPISPAGFVGLNIAQLRHGHRLQLRQADGILWNVQPAANYEARRRISSGRTYTGTPRRATVRTNISASRRMAPNQLYDRPLEIRRRGFRSWPAG